MQLCCYLGVQKHSKDKEITTFETNIKAINVGMTYDGAVQELECIKNPKMRELVKL